MLPPHRVYFASLLLTAFAVYDGERVFFSKDFLNLIDGYARVETLIQCRLQLLHVAADGKRGDGDNCLLFGASDLISMRILLRMCG